MLLNRIIDKTNIKFKYMSNSFPKLQHAKYFFLIIFIIEFKILNFFLHLLIQIFIQIFLVI